MVEEVKTGHPVRQVGGLLVTLGLFFLNFFFIAVFSLLVAFIQSQHSSFVNVFLICIRISKVGALQLRAHFNLSNRRRKKCCCFVFFLQ